MLATKEALQAKAQGLNCPQKRCEAVTKRYKWLGFKGYFCALCLDNCTLIPLSLQKICLWNLKKLRG